MAIEMTEERLFDLSFELMVAMHLGGSWEVGDEYHVVHQVRTLATEVAEVYSAIPGEDDD